MSASREAPTRWRGHALLPRILSSLILAPVAVAAVWVGGWWFTGLVLAAVLLAAGEFLVMARRSGLPVPLLPSLAACAVILLLPRAPAAAGEAALLACVLLGFVSALRPPIAGRFAGLAAAAFAVLFVAGGAVHWVRLRELEQGVGLLVLVVIATWAADVFAFFVGVRWGRRRIVPHVSPGKSLEGFLGGLAGAVVLAVAASLVLRPAPVDPARAALLGAAVGLAGPVGDLVESLAKRTFHAKDTSQLVPGHGGVLDRIDSLLVTGPVVFHLVRVLG